MPFKRSHLTGRTLLRAACAWSVCLFAAASEPVAQESAAGPLFQTPTLVQPLAILLPHDAMHLLQAGDEARVLLRIDAQGRVEDWAVLDLAHHRFLASVERALRGARFQPASLDGEPVAVDVGARIPLDHGGFYGIISVSMSEHIESRMQQLAPNQNRLILSDARDLDRPLRLVEEGQLVYPVDDDGRPMTGSVAVEFYVDPKGLPRMARAPDDVVPVMAEAARRSVEALRFAPPTHNGRPTIVRARISIVFSENKGE